MIAAERTPLENEAWSRAVVSRDPRFDGVFFVGIRTTGIYCRPVCPARVSYPERRRFFASAAAAERDGYRPCLRCRPELAPGRAVCDAVPRVARAAALRIAAGALNGRSVADLASDLGVSERHLRRAMERELGVAPLELAQTHRLLLAKCLLTDTSLPVTRVAFASGFQSLRRFNAVFRERYRLSPSVLRQRRDRGFPSTARDDLPGHWIRLTLGYRAPLAWGDLLAGLAPDTPAGVGVLDGSRYGRTVALNGCRGVIFLEVASRSAGRHVTVDLSVSLLPAIMPLLSRLRHLLDLDAEPAVIDAHLADQGLGDLVRRRPGLRLPGALDGFEVAVRELLGPELFGRVTDELGEAFDTGIGSLNRLGVTARRIGEAGGRALLRLGVPPRHAEPVLAIARMIETGVLRLEPGAEAGSTMRALVESAGVSDRIASVVVMRTLHWPDAFPVSDRSLQAAAGAGGPETLGALAEHWRPWRAYAAMHLARSAADPAG